MTSDCGQGRRDLQIFQRDLDMSTKCLRRNLVIPLTGQNSKALGLHGFIATERANCSSQFRSQEIRESRDFAKIVEIVMETLYGLP